MKTIPTTAVGWPRSGEHVALLLELMRVLREPFGMLYVLTIPRGSGETAAGRYQSPKAVDRAEAEAFLNRFRDFFEGDARHDVWVRSMPDAATLVYDNHDIVYAYGPLDRYMGALRSRGYKEADVFIPSPHEHHYNAEFDAAERDVLATWNWIRTPLRPEDE